MIHRRPIWPRATLLDYLPATTRQVVKMFYDPVGMTVHIVMMGNIQPHCHFHSLRKIPVDRE